jgi:hypothetical protein
MWHMGLGRQKAPRLGAPDTGADAGATGSYRNPQKPQKRWSFRKNLEKVVQKIVRAAYLFAILVAVTSCSILGNSIAKPDAEDLPALGMTECTPVGPIAWVNVDVLGTPDEKGTIAHEKKHVEQIRRFPSCAAFEAWFRENQLLAEAEAFCEEVYDDVRKERRTQEQAIARYGRWLAGYAVGVTQREGEALLRKVCRQA